MCVYTHRAHYCSRGSSSRAVVSLIAEVLAVSFYVLGASVSADVYRDEIKSRGMVVEEVPDKIAFAATVACWPIIELYTLIFRGDH